MCEKCVEQAIMMGADIAKRSNGKMICVFVDADGAVGFGSLLELHHIKEILQGAVDCIDDGNVSSEGVTLGAGLH